MPTAGTAFGYTGGIQTFTAPVSGTYQLTAYGAQGGNSPGRVEGGYGGYAKHCLTPMLQNYNSSGQNHSPAG